MIICGIDPSLRSTGYAIVDGLGTNAKLIRKGRISSDSSQNIEDRILAITKELTDIVIKEQIDYVVIEKPALMLNNKGSTIQSMAGLYFVLACKLISLGYLVIPVMPMQWKKLVGVKGKDRKEQKANSLALIRAIFGVECKTDDEADAVCIALYGSMIEVECGNDG